MATTASGNKNKLVERGKSPFNVEYGKLMMWYFLMSDAFTFGAFLISYGTIRFSRISGLIQTWYSMRSRCRPHQFASGICEPNDLYPDHEFGNNGTGSTCRSSQ